MTQQTPRYSMDSSEFSGKRILVTGGTKGAGGAVIATTARSGLPEGLTTDVFVQANLSTPEGVSTVADTVLRELRGVDILVHNVGGSNTPGGGFAAVTDELWQEELNLNLLSAVRLDRALVPQMVERGSGVVIHVSSIQRRLPLHGFTSPPRPMLRPKPPFLPIARLYPRNSDPRAFA